MFSYLSQYSITWIDAIGTSRRYPPTEGWAHLVEQWIASIDEPVYGVGHSLGGYLNYLAAVRRPELFHAIVLLDAPIIGPFRGRMLGATKRLGIAAHFRTRKLFENFAPQCLADYVEHGLVEKEGGLRLKIDPLIEYQIYRTIPHDMMRHLKSLRVPAAFIGGAESDVVRRVRLAGMKTRFLMRKVPGGHLFPFEQPRQAARSIARVLEELAASPRSS